MKRSIKFRTAGFLTILSIIALQSCEKDTTASISAIEISGMTQTSAVAGINISRDGGSKITERGVEWNTSPNPATGSQKTTEGTGAGVFYTILTGLSPNTPYFVRAYATNSQGTVYGNEISFKTSSLQDGSSQKADFPGGSRSAASGFSIGNKLYVGLGSFDDRWTPTKDSWEYDPGTDTRTQKASLPASAARSYATGFSIGNKGYVPDYLANSIGYGFRPDFREWDQGANAWYRRNDLGGYPRVHAVGISTGNKAYIGLGHGTAYSKLMDLWEYDPE